MIKRNLNLVPLLLIILAGFITYANSLNNEFVWDDEALIVNNKLIKDFHSIGNLFTTSLFQKKGAGILFYRPLQALTYALDYSIWNLNPIGYHLTNLLLHVTTASLVYLLIMRISGNIIIAFLTGLFFVVHPIQTEAVTYISGRADPLAALFILASLLVCIKIMELSRPSIPLLALLALTSLLAFLSRESALILPLLAMLLYWTFMSKKTSCRRILIVLACASVAYLVGRHYVFGFIVPESNIPGKVRLCGFLQVFPVYIRLLLYPKGLHMERYLDFSPSLFEIYTISGLIFLLLYVLCVIWAYKRSKELFFGLTWFFISLIPHSGIVPLNAVMAEHWLYLPSIGFFFLLSMLLVRIGVRNIGILIIVSILILIYGWGTIHRNRDWKDPLTFYTATLKFSPNSARLHHLLGNVWRDREEYIKAIEEYKRAASLRPIYPSLWNDLGVCWFNIGEYDKAKGCYRKALAQTPEFYSAYYNMGLVCEEEGLIEKAILWYRRALDIEPLMAEARCNLGAIYYVKGFIDKAESEYKNAIIANPFLSQAHYNLGILYEDKGLLLKAAEEYDRVSERDTEYYSKAFSRMKKLHEKILDKSL